MVQFSQSPISRADHGGFAVKFLVALFFLVEGIEDIKRKPSAIRGPAQDSSNPAS